MGNVDCCMPGKINQISLEPVEVNPDDAKFSLLNELLEKGDEVSKMEKSKEEKDLPFKTTKVSDYFNGIKGIK